MALSPDVYQPKSEEVAEVRTREARIDKILKQSFNGSSCTIRHEEFGANWVQTELFRLYRAAGWQLEEDRSVLGGQLRSYTLRPAD